MDLKENWRAWHSSLDLALLAPAIKGIRGYSRKVTGGFRDLDLLFCEESGKSHNVGVDVFLADGTGLSTVCSHFDRGLTAAE